MRRNGGPDGPVGSGATGVTVDGVDAIEGAGMRGRCLPIGAGPPDLKQQATAGGNGAGLFCC